MNRIIRNGTARVPDVTMYRPQRAASLKGEIPVKTISAAALALGLALPALAHEAPIDTHTELVPIPAYNLPFGAASAAASLQAAEVFLASFDEATKGLCQVNRTHSEISVNCQWLLYAISMA